MNQIVDYNGEFAKAARQYMQDNQVKGGGQFLSIQGGILAFGEEQLPGNQMAVVVLDAINERTFYDSKFDPNNPTPPVCYGFARGNEEMGPHESMQNHPDYFVPQANDCRSCPHNEWGSAAVGRGKACQERARIALLPAGFYEGRRGSRDFDLHLFDSEDAFASADLLFLKLPVLSVKNWSKYVQFVGSTHNLPPYGVITRVWVEPDPKSQYRVNFEMLEKLPEEFARVIFERHAQARDSIITAYTPPEQRETQQPGRGGLRGLRR